MSTKRSNPSAPASNYFYLPANWCCECDAEPTICQHTQEQAFTGTTVLNGVVIDGDTYLIKDSAGTATPLNIQNSTDQEIDLAICNLFYEAGYFGVRIRFTKLATPDRLAFTHLGEAKVNSLIYDGAEQNTTEACTAQRNCTYETSYAGGAATLFLCGNDIALNFTYGTDTPADVKAAIDAVCAATVTTTVTDNGGGYTINMVAPQQAVTLDGTAVQIIGKCTTVYV